MSLRKSPRLANSTILSDDGSGKISRIGFSYFYADTNEEEIDRLESLRRDVTASGFSHELVFPFDISAVFVETSIALPREVMTSLSLSIASVGLVTFLLIGNPILGLICMFIVGFILVDVVGFMFYSGYNLSSVSVIALSVSVGFSCDSFVHIDRSFLEQVGNRRERTIAALGELGPPVFHAVFSTFLAIMGLFVAEGYIAKSLFSGFASLLILAATHSLVLLHILLSLWGPPGFYRTQNEREEEELKLEETTYQHLSTSKETSGEEAPNGLSQLGNFRRSHSPILVQNMRACTDILI